jgi:hypothetical protein
VDLFPSSLFGYDYLFDEIIIRTIDPNHDSLPNWVLYEMHLFMFSSTVYIIQFVFGSWMVLESGKFMGT